MKYTAINAAIRSSSFLTADFEDFLFCIKFKINQKPITKHRTSDMPQTHDNLKDEVTHW